VDANRTRLENICIRVYRTHVCTCTVDAHEQCVHVYSTRAIRRYVWMKIVRVYKGYTYVYTELTYVYTCTLDAHEQCVYVYSTRATGRYVCKQIDRARREYTPDVYRTHMCIHMYTSRARVVCIYARNRKVCAHTDRSCASRVHARTYLRVLFMHIYSVCPLPARLEYLHVHIP